ncbi:ABC transporter ATP-binding protein [Dokdonella sp.]|uniref:ABC transporter ATP-binding protein n=1 Tax=Dokdonella sp. TaxID=2291710 RepID=UPI003C33B11D
MNQDEPIIRIRGLRNQFGSQVVHENLDLDVYRGNIIGVVGGSGSGKSVLLRSIIGLGRPAAGSIRLFGEEVSTLSDSRRALIERRCGVLFQNGALFSSLTVAENVAVALTEHHDLDPQLVVQLSNLKIALAGLPLEAGDKYPSQLSGGMVKRAALARSLALDPDILFLDEPTAGLDPIGAAAFDQLILTLRDSLGLTVFLITHDLDTLYTICDRVAVLADKRILVADSLDVVETNSNEWIQEYFQGPRGRAAQRAAANHTDQHAGH